MAALAIAARAGPSSCRFPIGRASRAARNVVPNG